MYALCNQIHMGGLSTMIRMIFPCVYVFGDTFMQVHSVLHLTLLLCCTGNVIYSSILHLHKNMPIHDLLESLKTTPKSCHIVHTDDLLDCFPWVTCSLKSAESFWLTSIGIQQVPKCLLVPFYFHLLLKTDASSFSNWRSTKAWKHQNTFLFLFVCMYLKRKKIKDCFEELNMLWRWNSDDKITSTPAL